MNVFLAGTEWGITVLAARTAAAAELADGLILQLITDTPNTHYLLLKVRLKHLTGEPIHASFCRKDVAVRDNSGNIYPVVGAIIMGKPLDAETGADFYFPHFCEDPEFSLGKALAETEAVIDPFFFVPNEAQIVDLIWADVEPIPLEIQEVDGRIKF
jgi:hypothetical protein